MTVEVCRNVPERQCPDNVTEIEGPCTPDKCIPEIGDIDKEIILSSQVEST